MLDHCSIQTQSGLVLWSKSYVSSSSPVDSLIREALIEERANSNKWDKDSYRVEWTWANEVDLVFVVAYQRILTLSYIPDLLTSMKQLFISLFESIIQTILSLTSGRQSTSSIPSELQKLVFGGSTGDWESSLFKGWTERFDMLVRELESSAGKLGKGRMRNLGVGSGSALDQSWVVTNGKDSEADETETPSLTASASSITDAEVIARNVAALRNRNKKKGKGGKAGGSNNAGSGSDVGGSDTDGGTRKTSTGAKQMRKWDDSKVTAADLAAFDFSSDKPSKDSKSDLTGSGLVDRSAMGSRGKDGLYEVKDYDVVDNPKPTSNSTAPPSALSSFFSKLGDLTGLGGPKVLTREDLAPALAIMREHLMNKNVAMDTADKICESVGNVLEGKKVSGGPSGVKAEVKKALEQSLTRILTPKTSTDILLDINRKKSSLSILSSSGPEPYSVVFVGVNGVGKSTNLSKVAFWLLQNRLRVLIAACDTFRSGAVEQLRVHVRNLGKLGDVAGLRVDGDGEKQPIELYERGYGKDAAGIAKDAIAYAKQNGFDVVLIDTAGRMQDNEPLMRALAKLVTVNKPDKIVFVGEALVGNEAVDQLTKFDRSLKDFSGVRGIDGMVLTKFDTVDEKVGAALSMTYVTGQPILFVGTGQTYSDLRALRTGHIVQALLRE